MVLLLSVLVNLSAAPAWAGKTFESGLNQYTLGRFRQALLYFALAEEEEPHNALVHYYLAECLTRTGHHSCAIVEYQLSYRLSSRGQVATYCKQALAAYKCPLTMTGQAGRSGSSPAGSGLALSNMSSSENELVTRAKSHIRKEVVYEKSKHRQLGDFFAAGALDLAEVEANRIREESARDIEAAMQPQVVIVGKVMRAVLPDSAAVKTRIDEIKRLAQERIASTRQLAQVRADSYRQWSKERQKSLDEVASNLENQLDEPAGHSSTKLQAVGTDLYTRYYGSLRASSELPEVRPAVARLIDRDTSITAGQGVLTPAGSINKTVVEKVVRGTILH